MNYPTEYIVECGYYPDTFAEKGLPPDVFFMHVTVTQKLVDDCVADAGLGAARHRYGLILREAIEAIEDAIKDKYRLDMGGPFSRRFDTQDCFWSCSERPEEPFDTDGGETYVGADAEYPPNAS